MVESRLNREVDVELRPQCEPAQEPRAPRKSQGHLAKHVAKTPSGILCDDNEAPTPSKACNVHAPRTNQWLADRGEQ